MSKSLDPLKTTTPELPLIIIAGDSWGCGEWEETDTYPRVVHSGISQYLKDDGYKVLNVSRGGSNINDSLLQIQMASSLVNSTNFSEPVKVFFVSNGSFQKCNRF